MGQSWNIRCFLYGMATSVVLLICVILLIFKFNTTPRPPAPPDGVNMPHPWGAMDSDESQNDADSDLEISITESLLAEDPSQFDPDNDGIKEYKILALSGGGSNGAFGSGILCGWSKSGNRPDFKIVTGVSTGALQATVAFLGPEYDYALKEVYTEYGTDEIYKKHLPLLSLSRDALNSTWPLKKIIDSYVDEKMLADVAAKHAAGRRLFIGTTNMDTQEFVIWDMGKIASSKREGYIQLYRDILLASASIPVLFPPVYFEVQNEGNKYYEMHYDGGAYGNVLFGTLLLEFKDALEGIGTKPSHVEIKLYIIDNGKSLVKLKRSEVSPNIGSIASVTINNLFDITFNASLYRIYVLSSRYGVDFNLATIGKNSGLTLDPMNFDKKPMQRLFNYSYELARYGYEWVKVPPGVNPNEVFSK
ncbi:MAG: patatin-like phospholipase family protein [Phycisphaerae bacterium]|nr:patatin-like phospholipase family protein [Phycisphaerae bacterium]